VELFKIGIGIVISLIIFVYVYIVYLRIDYYLAVKAHERAKKRQEAYFAELRDSEL